MIYSMSLKEGTQYDNSLKYGFGFCDHLVFDVRF